MIIKTTTITIQYVAKNVEGGLRLCIWPHTVKTVHISSLFLFYFVRSSHLICSRGIRLNQISNQFLHIIVFNYESFQSCMFLFCICNNQIYMTQITPILYIKTTRIRWLSEAPFKITQVNNDIQHTAQYQWKLWFSRCTLNSAN